MKKPKEAFPTYRDMRRALLDEALSYTKGNRSEAARLMGVSLRTCRNWINEFRLKGKYPPRLGVRS